MHIVRLLKTNCSLQPLLEKDSTSPRQVHYLPHHPVIKESKGKFTWFMMPVQMLLAHH